MIRNELTQEHNYYNSEFNKLLSKIKEMKSSILNINDFSVYDLKSSDKQLLLAEMQPLLKALKGNS